MEQITEPTIPSILPEIPSVAASFEKAWKLLWSNIGILLLTWIVVSAIALAGQLIFTLLSTTPAYGEPLYWQLASFVFSVLIIGPLEAGILFVMIRISRGQNARVRDAFEGFNHYGSVILLTILFMVILFGGFLLLIVPGIFFMIRLYFAPFLLIEKRMGAIDAIKGSWELTKGRFGQMLLLIIISIPVIIGGLLALLVGLIPAAFWVSLAFTVFYSQLTPIEPEISSEFVPITVE
ncbi:MAG: hypothetical protein HN356_09455 [Calditrichaeota bacterium]|nr:hypothetical protein [Calditrichota bacterium]MBT7787471.1 hypothetical protein [Calditrichota bacterium]